MEYVNQITRFASTTVGQQLPTPIDVVDGRETLNLQIRRLLFVGWCLVTVHPEKVKRLDSPCFLYAILEFFAVSTPLRRDRKETSTCLRHRRTKHWAVGGAHNDVGLNLNTIHTSSEVGCD